MVLAKDTLRESSSEYAQGGIAAALSDDDEVSLHEQDTLFVGDGLCDPAAVRTLVEEGPAVIQELIEWGAEFDRDGPKLLFAREGAHSRNRVLHAHGDSTGREIARTLFQKAASLPNVEFHSFAAMTDLLVSTHGIAGATAYDEEKATLVAIHARATLLATGGLGCVYSETTNPGVATGDGVAAAYRAGATIGDIEFVQFHPTALHVKGAPRFLLSEALRGEGAYLRNAAGERFMERYHPLQELAPRDVVSRAIVMELQRTGTEHVFLDMTHLASTHLSARFPRIFETCLRYGFNLETQPVPVHPAAHYAMGGVRTDLDGRTDLPGLYAAGEAACTGVHGANRLASNSLLEGVVFGARAGRMMMNAAPSAAAASLPNPVMFPALTEPALRSLTWECCGILRDGRGLARAAELLDQPPVAMQHPTRADFERRSLRDVGYLIARCALAREESRGGHYRLDFPEKRTEFQKHSQISINHDVRFS